MVARIQYRIVGKPSENPLKAKTLNWATTTTAKLQPVVVCEIREPTRLSNRVRQRQAVSPQKPARTHDLAIHDNDSIGADDGDDLREQGWGGWLRMRRQHCGLRAAIRTARQ